MDDFLSVNDLHDLIGESTEIYHYDILDSTSTEARHILGSGRIFESGFIVIADTQTDGRGRQGRSFVSSADNGLYFTYVIPQVLVTDKVYSGFTTMIAVAVAESLNEQIYITADKRAQIKWVNDIYVNRKKVCGILCEALKDYFLIGIGINIYEFSLPEELQDKVGFINPAVPCKTPLLALIIQNINKLITEGDSAEIIKRARELSMLIGSEIVFVENNQEFEATVLGIEDDGGLKVRLNDGSVKVLTSGEISIKSF